MTTAGLSIAVNVSDSPCHPTGHLVPLVCVKRSYPKSSVELNLDVNFSGIWPAADDLVEKRQNHRLLLKEVSETTTIQAWTPVR